MKGERLGEKRQDRFAESEVSIYGGIKRDDWSLWERTLVIQVCFWERAVFGNVYQITFCKVLSSILKYIYIYIYIHIYII